MVPTRRVYRWFYDNVQSRYYDLMIKWCFLPFGGEKKVRKRLLEPITFHPMDKILDVGCGTGSATFAIAAKAPPEVEIIGLDLSWGQIRRAKAKNRFGNVNFAEGDAMQTCFRSAYFDKVLITHMIHELPRNARLATLKEAARVLKTDGTLAVLELDNPKSLLVRAFVACWWFYWLPLNFETPTRRDMLRHGLANEVEQAGLTHVRTNSFAYGALQTVEAKKSG
jgi:ubiquinone/menaquinone biosynthesis C-methylase UbiE